MALGNDFLEEMVEQENSLREQSSIVMDLTAGQFANEVVPAPEAPEDIVRNSFFMAKLDKLEAEEALKEDSLPGVESIKLVLPTDYSAGVLANGHIDTDTFVNNFFKAYEGLNDYYSKTKTYLTARFTTALSKGKVDLNYTLSARACLYKSDIIFEIVDNFVKFYGSDKPKGSMDKFSVPENFKVSNGVKDLNNLAPIYIGDVGPSYIDIHCAPLENYKGDADKMVTVRLEMIKDINPTVKEIGDIFNRTVKFQDYAYKELKTYLHTFSAGLKRLGSKDIFTLIKQTASAGGFALGIFNAIMGALSGLSIGAILGMLGGPVGIMLGAGFGLIAGLIGGGISGYIQGVCVGACVGVAITPIALGIRLTLFNTRHRTLDAACNGNLNFYRDIVATRDELFKAVGGSDEPHKGGSWKEKK